MDFLWVEFKSLAWWEMILWVAYVIYFIARAWKVWDETSTDGIKEGYKNIIVGNDKAYRLYHLVRTILDIPPLILGLLFPFLSWLLSFKLYTFKEEKKK